MKSICFALATIILPFACKFTPKKRTSVSGTYVRVAETEINTVYDTLDFSLVNDKTDELYEISQRSSTHFKKKEEQGFNKKSERTITGTYDDQYQVIRTPDPGIVYSFDYKNATVTTNGVVYRKIP